MGHVGGTAAGPPRCPEDVKGNIVDVKGNHVDVKRNIVDVKVCAEGGCQAQICDFEKFVIQYTERNDGLFDVRGSQLEGRYYNALMYDGSLLQQQIREKMIPATGFELEEGVRLK
eukprot:5530005-Pyramimonas_sp.AAC.1